MAQAASAPGSRRVLLVDPGHQVPDYDRFLAAALVRAGWRVDFAAAPLTVEDALVPEGVEPRTAFAPWLAGSQRIARLLRAAPAPRRLPSVGHRLARASRLSRRTVAQPDRQR
jgi:hypothetical protein